MGRRKKKLELYDPSLFIHRKFLLRGVLPVILVLGLITMVATINAITADPLLDEIDETRMGVYITIAVAGWAVIANLYLERFYLHRARARLPVFPESPPETCPACKYDLAGLGPAPFRCPECGTLFFIAMMDTKKKKRS